MRIKFYIFDVKVYFMIKKIFYWQETLNTGFSVIIRKNMQARTNYFPHKKINYVYMAYMDAVYKFGRLCGHTTEKIFYLLVRNTNKRKRNAKYGVFGNYR